MPCRKVYSIAVTMVKNPVFSTLHEIYQTMQCLRSIFEKYLWLCLLMFTQCDHLKKGQRADLMNHCFSFTLQQCVVWWSMPYLGLSCKGDLLTRHFTRLIFYNPLVGLDEISGLSMIFFVIEKVPTYDCSILQRSFDCRQRLI